MNFNLKVSFLKLTVVFFFVTMMSRRDVIFLDLSQPNKRNRKRLLATGWSRSQWHLKLLNTLPHPVSSFFANKNVVCWFFLYISSVNTNLTRVKTEQQLEKTYLGWRKIYVTWSLVKVLTWNIISQHMMMYFVIPLTKN